MGGGIGSQPPAAENHELVSPRCCGACLYKSEGGNVQILVEGQTIRHQQYGVGIVTESNMERTTIDFDDHGMSLLCAQSGRIGNARQDALQ